MKQTTSGSNWASRCREGLHIRRIHSTSIVWPSFLYSSSKSHHLRSHWERRYPQRVPIPNNPLRWSNPQSRIPIYYKIKSGCHYHLSLSPKPPKVGGKVLNAIVGPPYILRKCSRDRRQKFISLKDSSMWATLIRRQSHVHFKPNWKDSSGDLCY